MRESKSTIKYWNRSERLFRRCQNLILNWKKFSIKFLHIKKIYSAHLKMKAWAESFPQSPHSLNNGNKKYSFRLTLGHKLAGCVFVDFYSLTAPLHVVPIKSRARLLRYPEKKSILVISSIIFSSSLQM